MRGEWGDHLCVARSWSGLQSCCLAYISVGMGHSSAPTGASGSAVTCSHVFLERKISLLLVVLNGTLNSSLKVLTKELSNLSLPF